MESRIVSASEAQVRCQCTVDLISQFQRPFLFQVNVWGEPPHAVTRVYRISAVNEERAASKGLELFEREMRVPWAILSDQGDYAKRVQ
jgi:hypothetical protein